MLASASISRRRVSVCLCVPAYRRQTVPEMGVITSRDPL